MKRVIYREYELVNHNSPDDCFEDRPIKFRKEDEI